jgi:hypothetical protein
MSRSSDSRAASRRDERAKRGSLRLISLAVPGTGSGPGAIDGRPDEQLALLG